MALKEITKKVVSHSEIPKGTINDNHWLYYNDQGTYVEVHLGIESEDDKLDKWLLEKYPELEHEESFFIHLDY